jgi:hypothetical protein
MLLAIEALAAQELVCQHTLLLSHLYESYARTLRMAREVRDPQEAVRLALGMGVDIAYLLSSVEASAENDLKEMPEILALRDLWEKQYERPHPDELSEQRLIWRPVDCMHCSVKLDPEFRA